MNARVAWTQACLDAARDRKTAYVLLHARTVERGVTGPVLDAIAADVNRARAEVARLESRLDGMLGVAR